MFGWLQRLLSQRTRVSSLKEFVRIVEPSSCEEVQVSAWVHPQGVSLEGVGLSGICNYGVRYEAEIEGREVVFIRTWRSHPLSDNDEYFTARACATALKAASDLAVRLPRQAVVVKQGGHALGPDRWDEALAELVADGKRPFTATS